LRELPKGTESSGSTPKSITSVPQESEELIENLRSRTFGKTVSLYGFDVTTEDSLSYQANQFLKASVINFVSNWYGLQVVPYGEKSDVVIANESDFATIKQLTRPRSSEWRVPIILVLCSQSLRFNRQHSIKESATVGILAKPIGPLKLARALGQCFDGLPVTTPGVEKDPGGYGAATESTDLTDKFEDLSLSPSGGGEVFNNSRMAAGSDNARKAIESPTPNAALEKQREFPFPVNEDPSIDTTIRNSLSVNMPNLRVESDTITNPPSKVTSAKLATTTVSIVTRAPAAARAPLHPPRLLLVDDNKINLTLLRTYMKKRGLTRVSEAENGQEAVDAVSGSTEGYDIIFMDISMPVLDGFEATRQIRQIELERRGTTYAESKPAPTPALIIALTGLASSRDQSEAFTSGVDLFLTKPVAFKEVGKMLDNWEANREREEAAKTEQGERGAAPSVPVEPNKTSLEVKI
jgi:CheY-like chemotaxis protein